MRYGLLVYGYPYGNTGNSIQSLAAASFLPQIDSILSYRELEKWDQSEYHKIIMNGFYLPEYFLKISGPSVYSERKQKISLLSEKILPYFISVHVSGGGANVHVDDDVKNYLYKHQPILTRDLKSADFLKMNKIDATFSGCLTLTLKPNKLINKQEYIVVATISRKLCEYIKRNTDKKIYDISSVIRGAYSWDGELLVAEEILDLLQGASCVITSRLHVALPCLALKTPVMVVWREQTQDFQNVSKLGENDRFSGMEDFFHSASEEEYLGNINLFNPNNPPRNNDNYIEFRNNLIKHCSDFIGVGCPYGSSPYRDYIWNKSSDELFNVENVMHNVFKDMVFAQNSISLKKKIKDYINKFCTLSVE